jgi:hypothetical protein
MVQSIFLVTKCATVAAAQPAQSPAAIALAKVSPVSVSPPPRWPWSNSRFFRSAVTGIARLR